MHALKINKNELSKKEKLDYYCNLNNIVTIATKNSKLGSQICGLSLPAGITCRPDAPCTKTCYCNKGFQICPTVLGTYMKNFRIYQEKYVSRGSCINTKTDVKCIYCGGYCDAYSRVSGMETVYEYPFI